MVVHHLGPEAFHRESVARAAVDLSQGGLIVVVLGPGDELPTEYGFHARVRPLEGEKIPHRFNEINTVIPANCRYCIFGPTRLSDRRVFEGIQELLKRRRVAYKMTTNAEAMRQAIAEVLPMRDTPLTETPPPRPEPAPAQSPTAASDALTATAPTPSAPEANAARGRVRGLIEAELPAILAKDPIMGNTEAARLLFRIAQDRNIQTTLASLAAAVGTYKRDHRHGTRPESVMTPEQRLGNAVTGALMALEQAAERVKAVREEYERVVAENVRLHKKVAKAAEVFEAFKGDVLSDE